jgi:hypothetical protein
VDDAAASLLMERFYTHLNKGMDKAEALRRAQLETMAEYPAPYYWAAFELSGDGGKAEQHELTNQDRPAPENIATGREVSWFGLSLGSGLLAVVIAAAAGLWRRRMKR